ncbi:MAG: hypothetical protein IKI31_00700 [Treponema sp.]|nr:hypothetical protein [Treponema sp.]
MLANEKKLVWNLLKNAQSAITGYTPKNFSHTPCFQDDPKIDDTVYDFIIEGQSSPTTLILWESTSLDDKSIYLEKELLLKMISAINLSLNQNCTLIHLDSVFFQKDFSTLLAKKIKQIAPKSILMLGKNIPSLTPNTLSLNFPLTQTYSPSDLLKNASLKKDAWEALKLFRTKTASLQ